MYEQRALSVPEDINLLDYLQVLRRRLRMILLVVGGTTLVVLLGSLVWPKTYRATAVLLPIEGTGGAMGGIAAQLGGLPFMGGLSAGKAGRELLAILQTGELAGRVVEHLQLKPVLFPERWDKRAKQWKGGEPGLPGAAGRLRRQMSFAAIAKTGTLLIESQFRDPALAVNVANTYVALLQDMLNENTFSTAKRNRLFVEQQLALRKKEFLEAGKALTEFYKGENVSNVDSKVDVVLDISPALQKLLLGGQLPQSQGWDQTYLAFMKEKERLGALIGQTDQAVVTDVPQQVYLQYLTLQRDVLAQITTLLNKQYELARIDENKEELAFQLIDPAVAAGKAGPHPLMNTVLAFIASCLFAIFLAFAQDYVEKAKSVLQRAA